MSTDIRDAISRLERVDKVELESFAHFMSIIEQRDSSSRRTIYRGEPISDTPLVPKIGRVPSTDRAKVEAMEQDIFKFFKHRVEGHPDFKQGPDWDMLALGQHHGLPTRLLDWSANPLVAAFFAAAAAVEREAIIYSVDGLPHVNTAKYSPFSVKKPMLLNLPPRFERIRRQMGTFSICPTPVEPLVCDKMQRLILKPNLSANFLNMLAKLGIHSESIFPGLDGICRYVAWSRGYALSQNIRASR
jgi:hypothetical protein